MPPVQSDKAKKPPACDACKVCLRKAPTQFSISRGFCRLVAFFAILNPTARLVLAASKKIKSLQYTPQYTHPLITTCSIKMDIRAVSYQLHLLPPQSRVLALCIICCAALTSFHPSVLGDGPRPQSFLDDDFFTPSNADLVGCGVRRAAAYRALRIEALKAAWEIGIILQPSNENAASCYLLDLLEHCDFSGISRPWANAYMSHVRALAPIWRASNAFTASDGAHWVGYLMGDSLIAVTSRTPMLVTPNDQLLLCGPSPPSLEALIASLSKSTSISLLWSSFTSFLYHIVNYARQLIETISGDYARLSPLSESAVLNFLSSLSLMHSVLALLLDHVDCVIANNDQTSPFVLEDTARTCAYGAIFGFSGLVQPFYRELKYREASEAGSQNQSTYDRFRFLHAQAHEMAILGARQIARGIRYLPKGHFTPVHWSCIFGWAEFCVEEMESGAPPSSDFIHDLETLGNELKHMGYSLENASTPHSQALLDRLQSHVSRSLVDMFLPPELPLEGEFEVHFRLRFLLIVQLETQARRVLCHPQSGGAPCSRCLERNLVCITTPVQRGRPRKNPVAAASSLTVSRLPHSTALSTALQAPQGFEVSSDSPELTPDFVSHCFEGLKFTPQYTHPLISATSIKTDVSAASYNIDLLAPQSRVLALCIICFVSLASFHRSVLGEGARPQSFLDYEFFSSASDLLACGMRRGPAFRALRAKALKAAWELGIILQPSSENAASCYLLDLTEEGDFSGIRPWANAYIAHIRALVPVWRISGYSTSDAGHWAGFLLLICGPDPPALEGLFTSIENSAQASGMSILWTSMKPYLLHVTSLARELSEKIAGDYARVNPVSEAAVIKFLSSLTLLHSVLSLLLDRVDTAITSAIANDSPFILEDTNTDAVARACAYTLAFGFTGLILPFYRELEYRENLETIHNQSTRERLGLFRAQARELTVRGARVLVRSLRYLPKIHYTPVHWATISAWAEFCVDHVESGNGGSISSADVEDLSTILNELKLLGYSLDISSTPNGVALIERLEARLKAESRLLDTALFQDIFPLDGTWITQGL
ncbi:Zn(2)-C6 fungal-type domain-containing protein [Favolaschia claudopus]|uniref:Zn(2)-C6 fungal-type domain-containing protein n=1 Tax=Favolaschia claudopus TaxID=2862362 RepID=A0AAW0AWG0_9AGAR